MPIPGLDQNGLLPVGTHDCSLQEIQQAFCWNPHRTDLFNRLQDFLAQRWAPLNLHVSMWVDGSFTRKKDQPDDIDLVVDVSAMPVEDLGPVITLWLAREQIKQDYRVDFWFKHPCVKNDLSEFFCYTGLKAAAELGLDTKHPKGILRIAT